LLSYYKAHRQQRLRQSQARSFFRRVPKCCAHANDGNAYELPEHDDDASAGDTLLFSAPHLRPSKRKRPKDKLSLFSFSWFIPFFGVYVLHIHKEKQKAISDNQFLKECIGAGIRPFREIIFSHENLDTGIIGALPRSPPKLTSSPNFFPQTGISLTAVVFAFIIPIAASSAIIPEIEDAGVSPGIAIISSPTEQTQVIASSFSNVNAPACTASIIP
jgi:hypothetical protein